MKRENGRLRELVKSGEVRQQPKTSLRRGRKKPFKTFRLKRGVRIEKDVKSVA